jgi:uncharacterized protein (DUF2062 family)
VRTWLSRIRQRIRWLWDRARNERASPKEIAWAVGVGVFAGCTPALGFHTWVAVGLATLFRVNRLFSFLGSRIANIVTLPFIALAEIQLAHRVRTGEFLALTPKDVLEQGRGLLLDWCLGTIPVGATLGAIAGVITWRIALRRARARSLQAQKEAPREPSDQVRPHTPA